jgi:hypothetical protein
MKQITEWCENTGIGWWDQGRKQLNKVIRKFNKWILNDIDDLKKTNKLLKKINNHLNKEYCNQDGGQSWKEELLSMKQIVNSKINN